MNAIEADSLTRKFGNRVAVDNLTLRIPEGAIFGFLGPNGAGKTTTVRMLAALITPSSGTGRVAGYEIGQSDSDIRRSVGILTETPGMYSRLTAMQNLLYFGGLYEMPKHRAAAQAERYLRMLELWDRRDEKVGTYSKGMRQKLAIARALLHEPRIVFLDEPTSGLDPEAARTVRDFVKVLKREGRTIFLTTHNLTEADELCDIVAVFSTNLRQMGTPAQLRGSLFSNGTLVRVSGDALEWVNTTKGLPFVRHVSAQDGALRVALDDPDNQNPILVQALVEAGAPIRYIEPMSHSLEEVYIQLVSKENGAENTRSAARSGE